MEGKNLIKVFQVVLFFFFFILLARLFQLQIINGSKNRFLAENNRGLKNILPAPRGLIFDRHGEILAQNEPVFFIQENGKKQSITRDESLKRQAEGEETKIFFERKYLDGENFAHLLGYLGEVNDIELKEDKLELKGYYPGSLIGRGGVEMQYESLLKGRDGSELIEVNTAGRLVRRINQVLPEQGKTLTLSVDKRLQETAAREMKNRKGAVVASIPQTGEILIFYSSPSYDANIFMDEKKHEQLVDLINDEEKSPFLNRVIAGLYPPGSTFKIVTSIAGLEEGKITEDTLINDPGVITVNDYQYSNWFFTQYGRTEGEINLARAITRSTDTYFYKVGERLGAQKLIFWAKKFGLNEKFGIDLPSELSGFIADPEWKEKTRGEKWFLGNTYHLAIGQGDIDLTPLGVNMMTSVVANSGKICLPRALRIGAENTPYKAECRDLGIKKEYLEIVKKGMVGACSSGGTGYPFFNFKPQVACKTGTAETGDGKTSHAWFTVFAPACPRQSADFGEVMPACEPEIVLTVLVERGGEGSSVAAPIAKEILKEYFRE